MNTFVISLFEWMVYGYIVGIMVNLIDREEVRGGVIGTVIFGMLGAAFTGLLIHSLNTDFDAFTFQGVLAGITGAVIVSIAHRFIFRINTYHIPKLTFRNRYFLNTK